MYLQLDGLCTITHFVKSSHVKLGLFKFEVSSVKSGSGMHGKGTADGILISHRMLLLLPWDQENAVPIVRPVFIAWQLID